jgi:hypothetical protein
MTDYLGSQAWRDELMDLLRTSATPPFAAVIAGTDQGLTDEEIAERWRELGGRGGRGPGGACTVKNVCMWWIDVQNALTARVPRSPRRAHDIAFALVQALQSPAAGPQFLGAGGAYYRRLYVVNPTKIPADWRDWNPRTRQR